MQPFLLLRMIEPVAQYFNGVGGFGAPDTGTLGDHVRDVSVFPGLACGCIESLAGRRKGFANGPSPALVSIISALRMKSGISRTNP